MHTSLPHSQSASYVISGARSINNNYGIFYTVVSGFTKDYGQRRYSNYPNAVPFIESQEGEGIQAIHFKLHPQL